MSRAPRAGTAGRPVTIRATAAERAQWTLEAEYEKCASLSAWIVKTLNRRAVHYTQRAVKPAGSAGVARERSSRAVQRERRGKQ